MIITRIGSGAMALAAALAMTILFGSVRPPPGDLPGGKDPEADRGARLFRELDCARCHNPVRVARGGNIPPSLEMAGSRSRTPWMAAYLQRPVPLRYRSEGVRPGLRMPAVRRSDADAASLAAFLAGLWDSVRVPEAAGAEAWALDVDLTREGATLFDQYQCRGCHSLAGVGGAVGPALDGVASRRKAAYVNALLLAPQTVIPGTAMKDNKLWDEEARALTAFVMTLSDPELPRPTSPRPIESEP